MHIHKHSVCNGNRDNVIWYSFIKLSSGFHVYQATFVFFFSFRCHSIVGPMYFCSNEAYSLYAVKCCCLKLMQFFFLCTYFLFAFFRICISFSLHCMICMPVLDGKMMHFSLPSQNVKRISFLDLFGVFFFYILFLFPFAFTFFFSHCI